MHESGHENASFGQVLGRFIHRESFLCFPTEHYSRSRSKVPTPQASFSQTSNERCSHIDKNRACVHVHILSKHLLVYHIVYISVKVIIRFIKTILVFTTIHYLRSLVFYHSTNSKSLNRCQFWTMVIIVVNIYVFLCVYK